MVEDLTARPTCVTLHIVYKFGFVRIDNARLAAGHFSWNIRTKTKQEKKEQRTSNE
jgi:hypothetical protein